MAILNHGSTLRTADGGQTTTTIVTAANIGTYGVATNSTYYVGTTQNIFNRASGAQTLTGVSIDGNAANITAYTINQNVGTANAPSFAGATLTSTLSITGGDGLRAFRAGAATITSHLYWANTTNTVAYNWQLDENNNAAMWGYTSAWGKLLTVTSAGAFSASGDVRAPIFYDSANTAYYLDPANTGTSLLVAGNVGIGTTSPATKLEVASTSDGILTLNKSSGTAWNYINFSQAGTRRFYFGLNASFEPELGVDNGGTFRVVGGMTVAGNAVLTSTSTLTAGNLSGTIPSGVLGNSTHYVGTTAIALNRASASQTLTGVSIDGNAATATNGLTTSNYVSYSAFTASLTSTVDARAPIFYDSNDTAYYLDAANTSISLKTRSSIQIINASAPQNYAMLNIGYNGGGETRAIDIQGGWSAGESKSITYNHGSGSTDIVAQINAQHNGPGSRLRFGKLYHGGNSSTYTMELVSESTTTAALYVVGSVRSPIFYDNDNTAYYIDAASTSVLNALTVGGEPVLTQANITFTPNGVGWYRILTAGGISSGTIRISGFYDNRSATIEFDYTVNGWGNQCYVTVRNNNNYSVGLITQIRVSNDGGASANSYLDIYIASSTTPAALTISNFGPIKGSLVSSPVVGATAGTSNVKTISISNVMGVVTTGVVNATSSTISDTIYFGDATTYISQATPYLKITTPSGYGNFGSANSSWFHMTTDRPNFYMAVGLHVNGDLFVYNTQSQLTSTSVRAPIFYDSGDTTYYLDPANSGTSMLVAGKVGIGITSPVLKLQVDAAPGNPGTTGTTQNGIFRISNSTDNAVLDFGMRAFGAGAWLQSTDETSLAANYPLLLNPNGANVGINNLSADTNLQVVGHVHVGNQTTFENTGGWNKTIYLDGTYHARLRILGSAYASGKNSQTETYLWVDNTVSPYSGLVTNAGSFTINAGFTTLTNSARSPIFYDSDNTSYYVDAASTSVINALSLTVLNNINAANGVWHNSAEGKGRFYFGSNSHTFFKTAADFIFRNNSDIGVVTIDSVGNLRTSTSGDNFASYSLHVGGTGFATADFRSPIFYDSANTAYYLDPANTGTSLLVAGNVGVGTTSTSQKLHVVGNIMVAPASSSWAEGLSFTMPTASTWGGLRWRREVANSDGNHYVGYTGLDSTDDLVFGSNNGGTQINNNIRITKAGLVGIGTIPTQKFHVSGIGYSDTDFRAPIFYDSSNTAYYIDAASTSNLVGLTVANTITGSISGNAGTVTNGVYTTGNQSIAGNKTFTGITSFTNASDYQISLNGSGTTWAGIEWVDTNGTDYMWYNGQNKTFAIGGGGSNISGKKLHVDGGVTIGADYDSTVVPSNGLSIQGAIQIGDYYIFPINSLSSSATQARTFEIARIGIDYNDWNGTGTFEVELHEQYYSRGLKKVYNIWYGYVSSSGIRLVEWRGNGDNNFQCRIGSQVLVTGDQYYLPVYVDVRNYGIVDVVVKTNRTITTNTTPAIGYTYINTAPTATNITDFTADSDLEISTLGSAKLGGNTILTSSNYSGYSTFSGSVTSTYGNFTSPGLIMGDAQYGFYVVSGNVYYKSASGGVHYWRNIANSANTMSLDNSGILTVSGNLSAPIFYDSNDTAYYLDPASTSRLNTLSVGTGAILINGAAIATDRNLKIKGATSTGVGIVLYDGSDNFRCQIYGETSNYGFLDSLWGGWDIKKTIGGNLNLNNNTTYYLNPASTTNLNNLTVAGDVRSPIFYDSNNTAYYCDPASTSNLNALTVAGGNATIYRDLIVNGGGSGNFGNRIIVQGTATTYTYQDTTLRPTVYLNGDYPVVTLNATATTNANHGPTLQFAFNGLTTGGTTSRQIVIGANGVGSWLDFGFSGGANGDNSSYNPHNGISGYNGVTAMRLFSNGLLVGSTGTYPSHVTSTSFALDVRGTGSSNTDFRAPIFYDSNNTAYYVDPNSTSNLVGLTVANTITGNITGNAGGSSASCTGNAASASYANEIIITSLGTATVSINNGRTAIYRNENGLGAALAYSPVLHAGAGDTMWQVQGTYGSSGNGTFYFRQGYQGVFGNWLTMLSSANYNSYSPTLTGTGASGSWGISVTGSSASCTGNSATTTLATKATRANGNFYIDDNYGNTVVGVYNAARLQGVFAMGDSYKLTADGTGVGTLYGLAWSHPNFGGVAANLADHGLLILQNGVFKGAWGGGSLRTPGDVRGTLFYDWDNTGYYCDPASTSNLNAITAAGNITAADYYTAGWFRSSTSGNGMYNQVTGQHFYSDSVNYWNVASSASAQGIRFRTGGYGGTVRGYVYADTNNDVGLLNQDGNWRLRVVGGDYSLADGSSMRAQIFYDSNDTSYYTDPAGTTILNIVRANSYVQKSASQSLSGTVGCTIDVNAAGIHVLTLAASTTISSFTYNNRTSNPSVNTIMLVIKYGGTASITWTNVLWANGTTPSLTSASGYADVYMLTSYQGGAATPSWIGTVVAQALVSTSL